ncbi:STAS domain protein [Collimonas arenae]|uniref:STAS domain protein n=1 Tax=Collimonas arenae TaxID=279058 RepID=A0A127QE02_9BURK|nr:STAS domain-containing protein [Collimonas arenae]AMP08288.1 STAS domain protein [Collimonas arenae]
MFRPSHSLTVGNAKVTLEEGLRAIAGGETEIDLSDVVAVDSAAVATLLAWQCAALNQGHSLHFSSLPANLESLIDLYGVTELLSPATVVVAASTQANTQHH